MTNMKIVLIQSSVDYKLNLNRAYLARTYKNENIDGYDGA